MPWLQRLTWRGPAGLKGRHTLLQGGNFSSAKAHIFRSKSAQTIISPLACTHLDIPTFLGKSSPTVWTWAGSSRWLWVNWLWKAGVWGFYCMVLNGKISVPQFFSSVKRTPWKIHKVKPLKYSQEDALINLRKHLWCQSLTMKLFRWSLQLPCRSNAAGLGLMYTEPKERLGANRRPEHRE